MSHNRSPRQHFHALWLAAVVLGWTAVPKLALAQSDDGGNASVVDIEISIAPVGNLFYQLECLAKRIRCSQQAYRSFWDSIGFGGKEDLAALQQFATILDIYKTRALLRRRDKSEQLDMSPFGPEIVDIGPATSKSIALLSRIQIAAYGSSSHATLTDRLSLLMHPGDVAAIDAVIAHFAPRFEVWWSGGVPESLIGFRDDLRVLLHEQEPGFITAVAKFYGAEQGMAAAPVFAHLVAHPLENAQTNGTMIENHAVLEVLSNEPAERRLGVLVHELAHYFFGNATPGFHNQRLEGALRAASPRASAALGLMNEALATAIGNGVLEERLRGPAFQKYFDQAESFYNSPEVDAAAKAIFPLVREYIDSNRSMDEQFVDRYFSLVVENLGPVLDSLSARLHVSAYVAIDDDLSTLARELPQRLGITSLYGADLGSGDELADAVLTRHTYLNGLALSRTRDLGALKPLLPNLPKLSLSSGQSSISCIFSRASGAVIYVVVTDQAEFLADDLIAMLQQADPCEAKAAH